MNGITHNVGLGFGSLLSSLLDIILSLLPSLLSFLGTLPLLTLGDGLALSTTQNRQCLARDAKVKAGRTNSSSTTGAAGASIAELGAAWAAISSDMVGWVMVGRQEALPHCCIIHHTTNVMSLSWAMIDLIEEFQGALHSVTLSFLAAHQQLNPPPRQTDLNPSSVPELLHPPTPLEFSRIVSSGGPALIRNYVPAVGWPAYEKWTSEYLSERMGEKEIAIAITPDGRADSIHGDGESEGEGSGYFVMPAQTKMTMKRYLSLLGKETEASDCRYYLQSQDDNLRAGGEYGVLAEDLEQGVEGLGVGFANEVFGESIASLWKTSSANDEPVGREPDAVNLWIGDEVSTTALHKDPYHNLYCVLQGSKTFTLFPPTELWALHGMSCSHTHLLIQT